jgi:hypothetical protein
MSLVLAGCFFLATACRQNPEGYLEGSVVTPGPGIQVTVRQSGKTISTVDAQEGSFRIKLSPGTYDVSVTSPASPFPVTFPGIAVDSGKSATLPPLDFAQRTGTAALSGTVAPATAGARVLLFYEGKERAAAAVTPAGTFEFTELPAGNYSLQAEAPGYAADRTDVRLPENRKTAQNLRLLFVSPVEGIDWQRGTIRATGRGLFPPNAPNRTVMHELAKRAALSEAERNLVKIIEQINVGPNHDLRTSMAASYTVRIQGFVRGHKIVGERELDNGMEVTLELPLTGPAGLTRLLTD